MPNREGLVSRQASDVDKPVGALMPRLGDRVDVQSITATFLPLPKGKKRGGGVGFCGGDPVASVEGAGYAAPPYRWVDGKPHPIGFQDIKKITANGASDTQLAGYWTTPKGDERAIVWTQTAADLAGVELHPPTWQKSAAIACGDGQQIGFGYGNFAQEPSKALLWSGTRESLIVLTGPDPSRDAMGHAVAGGVQVGYVGGSGRQHACLWRGSTDSHLDLHPTSPDLFGSEALGIGDGQQVGVVWTTEMANLAALWNGSPDSYINLSPAGFARSRASRCAAGFQVGWVCREERGMLLRAALWNGAGDDFIDLQDFLNGPWNASWAQDLRVDGDRLVVLGTAQQAVQQGKYEMDAGKVPVMWEMKLLVAEAPRAGRSVAVAAPPPPSASDEQKVDRIGADFATAVIENDFEAARACLAPWLQGQVDAKQLRSILRKEFIDDVEPADFAIGGNDSTLDDLRAHYREYHEDNRALTLATATEFGAFGPPSIHIADEVTPANFRQWMSIEFTPDPESESELDYCLRLWLIVVDVDGAMSIGHLEPGE
jgi:hypothetical protein